MPSNQANINIGVKYNVDQSSVNAVKKSLQDLQHIKIKDFSGTKNQLDQIKNTAKQVESALDSAFNVNLNSLNVQTFNQQLKSAGLSVDQVYQTFSKAGAQGQVAFRNMASSILTTNLQLKQTKGLLTSMGETMVNTVKWGIASSVMNSFTNSVQQAFQYAKSLDGALTDIRIVTGDSTEQMRQFAKQANNAAQNLGRSTMDYTKAALSFYQQGLSDEQVQTRTETVLKAQNITGAGQEMADYLTAVWNGYKVANQEAELYVDKLAAVADSSASNMSQLAVAMSKVASSANALGVPVDNLNAQIATIVATTRQAPESVGNALKTIYSRINDITTGADDAEVSLGNYSKQMASIGFSVLDANGNLRDTGDVLDEIGGKWQTLSREQQIYLARTMAGQRQYNNLIALFDNWGKYTDLVNISMQAQGTTMQKNSRYMDSLGAKIEQLGAAGQKVKDALINEEDLKGLVSTGAQIVNLFGSFIESIGGGRGALLAFGSLFTQLFSGTITKQIDNIITRIQNAKNIINLKDLDIQQTKLLGVSQGYKEGAISEMIIAKKQAQQYYQYMDTAQINEYNNIVKEIGLVQNQIDLLQEKVNIANKYNESISEVGENKGNNFADQLDIAIEKANALDDILSEVRGSGFNFASDYDNFAQLSNQVSSLRDNLGEGFFPKKALEEFDTLFNILDTKFAQGQTAIAGAKEQFIRFVELAKTFNQQSKTGNTFAAEQEQNKKALEQQNAALELLIKNRDKYLNGIAQASNIKLFVNTLSGIGQTISGFNSLIRVTKIWQDQSLSAGEKVTQTFTAISMGLPMIINGFSKVEKAYNTVLQKGKLLAAANQLGTKASFEAMVAQQMKAGMTKQEAIASVQATIAAQGHAIALKQVAASAWAALAPLLPYVAAVGAVVAAGYALYKEWNKESQAAQKAAKTASQAKKTYEDLKSTYDDLKSSLEDYNSAQEAISQMTKGTQQWRDAIRESNDAVLQLIKNYPQLANQVKNVNGQLKLSEYGQQEALKNASEAANNARLASNIAGAQSREASFRASARQASRFAGVVTNNGEGYITATTDQVVKVIEAYSNTVSTSLEEQAKLISEETGISQEMIVSILSTVDNMDQLAAELRSNTQATKLAYETTASENLQDNSIYQGFDQLGKQVANVIAGNDLKSQTERIIAEIESRNINRLTSANQIQDILDRYNAATNQNAIFASNAVTKGGNINLVIDGQNVTYSKQQIAQTIAAAQALQNVGTSANKAAQMLSKIDKIENGGEVLKNLIAGNGFGDLTQSQLENLNPYSKQMVDIFNTYAEDAGYEGGKAFQDAFIETQQATLEDFNHVLDNSSKAVIEGFNQLDVSHTTLNLQKEIVSNLQQAFTKGGREGLKNLTDFYDNITDFSGLENISSQLDFSTISTEQLKIALQNAGIATNLTTQQLQAYIQTQKQATQILSPEKTYKDIHDIIDNLKTGDTIDAQQASVLEAAGISLEGYFKHMADGSLRLESSAKEFYEYANNQSLEGFKTQIQSLKNTISNQAGFNNQSKYSFANEGDFESFSSDAYDNQNKNTRLLSQQLNFLQAIGVEDQAIAQTIDDIERKREVSTVTTEKISKLVQQHRGDWENLESVIQSNIQQLRIYNEQLNNANNIPLDPDIDEQQWQNLTDYLNQYGKQLDGVSQHLQQDRQAAEELAEAMLRYDHALEEVADHYKDWQKALTSGSLQEQVEVGNQLQNVYADLLDLPFESLSPDFTQNIQNLHLLQEAANGSEAAYNQLLQAAQQDIESQVHITMDDLDFWNAKNQVQTALDDMNFQDIQIGANLDTGNFLQSLTELVNAAGMTADQATDYLSSMGIDAKVTEHSNDTTETQEIIGSDPVENNGYIPYDYTFLNGNQVEHVTGNMMVPGYYYRPRYQTVTGIKQNKAFSLQVESAHKKSGGGFKFSNASHGGGSKAPKSSGKGGGKGGGGKGSTKKPTVIKTQQLSEAKSSITDRSDVYHDVNLALKEQEDKLDDIENKQKKLVNRDRLENLQEQNKELEKQKDLLDQKSGIAASELVRLRNELIGDLGNSIQFDPDGAIANYNAALDKARDNYNDSIADYNRKVADAEKAYNNYVANYNSMSAQAQEKNKTQLDRQKDLMDQIKKQAQRALDVEKEKYDAIKSNVKEYQDTLDLQKDIADQQQEIIQKMYENLIAMSKIKVDLSLDTGEFERDWLEFENKFIKKLSDDDFLGSAKANVKELISYFNSDQVQQTAKQIEKIRDEIAIMERGGTSAIYGDNLAQAKEDLEQYMKQQMEDLENIQDLVDDIKDNYLDALDDAKQKMDDQINQYERVNDLIEHNVKLVDLLYGDKAYDTMNKYYDFQKANNERELQSLKMQQDYWQNLMNNETVGSEAWKEMKKNLDDVTDNLNSKLEDIIQNLSDQWQNRIDGIIAKLNNALSGGRGLDYLDQQWDYINDFDDNFLDTFESRMGIQEVTDLYKQAIDGLSGSPSNQQKINKLMNDQLKILREKDNLTQYDIDRAKAALEVEKARMALEEARYNKTKMRLRRDSQGNYTYQYVADEQKLSELQSALADAQANLYNMDKEHYTENLNNLYDAYKDYLDKMRDLTEEYNNTQDEEERARIQSRIDLLKENANDLMGGLTEDNRYALQYLNNSFFGGMGIDTALMSADQQMELMIQNIPQVNSNIQDLANNIVGQGGLLNATHDALDQINKATVEYDQNIKQFLNDAGTSLETISEVTSAADTALDNNIINAQNLITTNDELIKSCEAQVAAIQELMSWLDQYMNKVMNVETLVANLRSAYNTGQQLNGSNLTADNISVTGMNLDTTAGNNFTGNPAVDAAAVKQQIDALMAEYEKFLAQMAIATFDTGGSTGSWGDASGRLAFLHEKELVLNQEDTLNILRAVQTVRAITSAFGNVADSGLSALANGANGFLAGINNTEQLDQNVHIEANFPNVTQHTEIEQAFENLVNMASMKASKYRD